MRRHSKRMQDEIQLAAGHGRSGERLLVQIDAFEKPGSDTTAIRRNVQDIIDRHQANETLKEILSKPWWLMPDAARLSMDRKSDLVMRAYGIITNKRTRKIQRLPFPLGVSISPRHGCGA